MLNVYRNHSGYMNVETGLCKIWGSLRVCMDQKDNAHFLRTPECLTHTTDLPLIAEVPKDRPGSGHFVTCQKKDCFLADPEKCPVKEGLPIPAPFCLGAHLGDGK